MISLFDIFDRESQYPVFDRLCDNLLIADIIALTQTCRRFSGLYKYLLPIQWDVDRRLARFVRDPVGLRSQMGRTDALISGSFALQYFERVTWPASDLDIFVEYGEQCQKLCEYLAETEEYCQTKEMVALVDQAYLADSLVMVLENVQAVHGRENHISHIHVIATWLSPVHALLQASCTTVAVNFLTWNAAYSVFPLTTFLQYRGYMLRPLNQHFASLVKKHTRRGWKIQPTMWPEDERFNHSIQETRRVGDRYTWKIPFDTRYVKWSSTPECVLEHACFGIHVTHGDRHQFHPVHTRVFNSPALRYTYTCHPWSWCEFLDERVDDLTKFELLTLKPGDRPTNYEELLTMSPGDPYATFTTPDTWTHWDDEVPRWYKAWEKKEERAKQGKRKRTDEDV
ncbi:MAG: hypothetical protein Q9186_001004 [Xanthomendoza sp. 1 TL-2023]